MVRPCALSLALLLSSGLTAQSTETLTVRFALASASLDPTEATRLADLCERRDIGRLSAITLTGHTDERGSTNFNRALSEQRAEAVRQALSANCLADVPVHVAWAGEQQPVARGSSEAAYASNRRVEVALQFMDGAPLSPPIAYDGIKPLFPALITPPQETVVDPTKDIDVTMSDGIRVRIPASAMVDEQGRPVEGPVQLSYRGFQDPYTIICSGIPMHVNTDAGTQHMESAGMYELNATADGRPLRLAEGQRINLEREGASPADEGYVSWALNERTGEWKQQGEIMSAAFTMPVASNPLGNATPATQAYWTEVFRLENERAPDSTLFADRRRSAHYCHLTRCDTAAPGTSWIKRRNRFRDESRVPEISVAAYKGIYDPSRVIFRVEMPRWCEHQFSDWRRVPHNALFQYIGPESRAVFKRLYGRRHFFQDIHLDMAAEATEGTLWLKENGEWLELPVSVQYDQRTPLRATRWKKAMTLYQKALARRAASFDRDVAKQLTRYKRNHQNIPLTAWREARDEMISSEKSMALAAWIPYAQERPYVMPAGVSANPWAMFATQRTSISIYGFGKVNVDRYLQMPEQVNVIASAIDEDGHHFKWVRGYAIPKGRNAVITYQGTGEGRMDALLVAPGFLESLFLVDADGRVMRADVRQLNAGRARAQLSVTPVHDPKTLDDLRAQATR